MKLFTVNKNGKHIPYKEVRFGKNKNRNIFVSFAWHLKRRCIVKVIKMCLIVLAGLLFCFNSLHADGSKWETDILIYTGPISCFDVDYTMDGKIFLGFQKDESPDYPLCFYTSEDHGFTWNLKWQSTSPIQRWSKMKILAGEPLHNWFYCFSIAPAADSSLFVWRIDTSFTGASEYFLVGEGPIENFDVTRTLEGNYTIYAAFLTGTQPSLKDTLFIYSSSNYGEAWEYEHSITAYYGIDMYFSIAYGPPSNIYLATSIHVGETVPDKLEICLFYKTGGIWQTKIITNNYYKDSDPHIAASNDPAHPAIWITDTYSPGGGNSDLCVLSVLSPDSIYSSWHYTPISITLNSEYWGDIKFFKESGNPYVNMAWIYDDGSTTRDVYWIWSGGADPTIWHDDAVINDHMAHPWPFGAAPRVVYSPGSSIGGGGVIYAGFGSQNLYFDAPWNTGVEEDVLSDVCVFSIYPSLITAKSPIKLSLFKNGIVEVSLYDVSGSLAYHIGPVFWNKGVHSVLLNQLSNGVYFLKLKLNNRLSGKAKLIILR